MSSIDKIAYIESQDANLADRIANTVLSRFDRLPAKYKPTKDSHGTSDWVPLSGIVLEDQDGHLECVSLATGMKCLPASKVALAQGRILHDSHAEVLALRAFNHFMLQECAKLLKYEEQSSRYLVESNTDGVPLTIHPSIKIHMYCSEAPCGDASMELIMQKQDDATPWTNALPSKGLLGRGHFSELGLVRRKPSRGDSPESLSKSCSDKLALKQCTTILSSHTSRFILPGNAYLTSIIIPKSQYVSTAITRSFGREGRMKGVSDSEWAGGYSFRPFHVLTTLKEFIFSQRTTRSSESSRPKASNLAAIWNPCGQEVIISGVLQGRRQKDDNCMSMVSRLRLGAEARQMVGDASPKDVSTYAGSKQGHPQLIKRARVKTQVIEQALTGWVSNLKDDFCDWPLLLQWGVLVVAYDFKSTEESTKTADAVISMTDAVSLVVIAIRRATSKRDLRCSIFFTSFLFILKSISAGLMKAERVLTIDAVAILREGRALNIQSGSL